MFKLATIYLIYIIPLFILGVFFIYKIYSKNKNFNSLPLSKMRNYKYSKIFFLIRILFLSLSFMLLFIAVLRPAWGNKIKNVEAEGSDIVFTLDVSQSMKALDVGNGSEDRLNLAKNMIAEFVTKYPSNRYGLVIFAGEAFVSIPLTIDTNVFLTFLDSVSYNDVSTQGTDINAALKASIDRFYSEQDKKRGRSIVIISDGGEEMTGDVADFAKIINDLDIKIFTIGIGNKKGVPIPEGRDVFGRTSYKKYKGETVLTKLNEKILKQIADKTGGEYFQAKEKDDLEKIINKLKTLKTTSIKTEQNIGCEDHYQYFLLPSFLFFILFIFLEFADKYMFFVKKIVINHKKYLKFSILILTTFFLSACSNSDIVFNYYNTKGNKEYANKYFKEAKKAYRQARESSHDLGYIADNNYAVSEYREEDYEKVSKKLEEAIFIYCEKNKKEYCDILYYNLGNAYYRLGNNKDDKQRIDLWQKAIESYKKDLEIKSNDIEAQENINFILNKLKEEKESTKSEQNNSSQNDQNQDQGNNSESKGQNSNSRSDSESQNNDQEGDGENKSNIADNDNSKEKTTAPKNNATASTPEKNDENQTSGDASDSSEQTSGQNFDEKINKQIEEYMKNLEKQERNNRDYFQPNPNGSYDVTNPFDNFFDDSFFNNFFDSKLFGGNFDNEKNSNEIDW